MTHIPSELLDHRQRRRARNGERQRERRVAVNERGRERGKRGKRGSELEMGRKSREMMNETGRDMGSNKRMGRSQIGRQRGREGECQCRGSTLIKMIFCLCKYNENN